MAAVAGVRVHVGHESVALSAKQKRAARDVDARAKSLDKRERMEGLARERALVAQVIGTAEERALLARMSETETLARMRGEDVARHRNGALNLSMRDGLASLFTSGGISGPMYLAGSKYRRMYEACHGGVPSQLRERTGGGDPAQAAANRSALEQDRLHVEAAVRVAAQAAKVEPKRAIEVLQSVAGAGVCLDVLGQGGAKRANKTALRVALIAIGVVLRVPGA